MSTQDKLNKYNRVPEPGTPRNTEAWALTQAALRMKAAQDTSNPDEMIAAIRLNWRLWTIFQADLLEPDCPLPEEIRVNVLNLANFVDTQTVTFLSAPQPSALNALININRQLAAGLYTEPTDDAQPTEPAAQMAGQGISA